MEYKKAQISDIPILAECRKAQLVDEGQIPNIDIDKQLEEAQSREFYVIRLFSSELGRPVYKRYGFEDTPGFMTLRLR